MVSVVLVVGWWWFIYTIHSIAEGGTGNIRNNRSKGNKTNINNNNTREPLPVHIFERKQGVTC